MVALQNPGLYVHDKRWFDGGQVLRIQLWKGPIGVWQVAVQVGGVRGPRFFCKRLFAAVLHGFGRGSEIAVFFAVGVVPSGASRHAFQVTLGVDGVGLHIGAPFLQADTWVLLEREIHAGARGIQVVIAGAH